MQEASIISSLNEKKRHTKEGMEFWMAREIQPVLGYQNWQNFEHAIEKAKTACSNAGSSPDNHFIETNKLITAGKGAKIARADYFLSRYACYLIAMNGDATKTEIAVAQTYFAIQTRRQELLDEMTEEERRVEKRQLVRTHNRHLAGIARKAGVGTQYFGIFQDCGYIGLYNMPSRDIKATKRIPEKDNLLDYAGCEELAANDFRITQTTRRLIELEVKDGSSAGRVHEEIGRRIRQTIADNGNPMPETLPIEPHIKTLERNLRKRPTAKVPDSLT
ncbi:MAG: DNA damage-inducible protein D [Blastocatellia bacterium]